MVLGIGIVSNESGARKRTIGRVQLLAGPRERIIDVSRAAQDSDGPKDFRPTEQSAVANSLQLRVLLCRFVEVLRRGQGQRSIPPDCH